MKILQQKSYINTYTSTNKNIKTKKKHLKAQKQFKKKHSSDFKNISAKNQNINKHNYNVKKLIKPTIKIKIYKLQFIILTSLTLISLI